MYSAEQFAFHFVKEAYKQLNHRNMNTDNILWLIPSVLVLLIIFVCYLRPKRCAKCRTKMKNGYASDSCHPLRICPRCGNTASGYDF